jgi:hypothetical protein
MGKFRVKTSTEPKIRIAGPREYNRGGPLARYGNAGLGGAGLGELIVHPAVLRFQEVYNIVYEDNQAMTSLPAALRLTGGTIEEDGKYGSRETQPAMERYVNLHVRLGICSGTSSYDVRRNGPAAARSCLLSMLFSPAEITELQTAWLEMQGRLAPASDGGGGGTPPGPDGGGGDGGGGPDPDVDVPRDEMPAPDPAPDAGVFGLILFGIDVVGGGLLAWAFGRK